METNPLLPWLFAAKIGLYVSSLLAAGIGLHAALSIIERDRRQSALRFAGIAALLAVALGGAKLAIVNAQLGGSLSAAFDPTNFDWTWRSQASTMAVLAAGAGMLVVAWIGRAPALAIIGALGIAASFALTGHAQALERPGIVPMMVGAHVLIATFWFGAPVSLWPVTSLSDEDLDARLRRFSAIATLAVPMLFGLGLVLAWVLAGGIQALVTTTYGQLLLAKLGVASVILALGAANKIVVSREMAANPLRGRKLLEITLTVDAVMFLSALALVGLATTVTGPADT